MIEKLRREEGQRRVCVCDWQCPQEKVKLSKLTAKTSVFVNDSSCEFQARTVRA